MKTFQQFLLENSAPIPEPIATAFNKDTTPAQKRKAQFNAGNDTNRWTKHRIVRDAMLRGGSNDTRNIGNLKDGNSIKTLIGNNSEISKVSNKHVGSYFQAIERAHQRVTQTELRGNVPGF